MPKSIPQSELEAVLDKLHQHPAGAKMGDLVGSQSTEAQRRAMQRRLKKLESSGAISKSGSGPHIRYHLASKMPARTPSSSDASKGEPIHEPTTAHPVQDDTIDSSEPVTDSSAEPAPIAATAIPLSTASERILSDVSRPLAERPPVGYQRKFLSAYQPNVTFYLSSTERQHLAKIGRGDTSAEAPAGTHARHVLDRLLIELSWNSSRLEGNTYSLLDTHALLQQGKVAEGKTAEETQMILNHKDAIEFLVEAADEIGFNRHTILSLHGLLSANLIVPEASGRLRQRLIGIGGSNYNPLQTPAVIEECFNELLSKATAIADPFEQSLFVAIQLPYLQPFVDVNKRVSRLAANIPFIRQNLSPVSFVDVPGHLYVQALLAIYELNKIELARDMFVWAYEQSARRYAAIRDSIGKPDPFRLRYREQLRAVVADVVRGKLDKQQTTKQLKAMAHVKAIPTADRNQFIEAVETELLGLHEGNFARFRIRPSEFFAWKAVWESA